jgi:TRAP-type mannitol/chloroaromatic compound transport system substrate-binding protein
MKRREIFAVTAGAVAGAAFVSPAPAIAQGRRVLRMVTTWPKSLPGLGSGAERLAKRIAEGSDGRLDVKVISGGELVSPAESFDAVADGRADLYHGAEDLWPGKPQAFAFFAGVPFGLTAVEMDGWVRHAGGQDLWDALGASYGVKPFLAGNTGVQMGGWFKREIAGPDDLRGLRIRMPGLAGAMLRRVGANPVSPPPGEIFPSLQTGAIDAAVWYGPWNDLMLGFYKVARFYYGPGLHEPGTAISVGINLALWDSLPAGSRGVIENAIAAENSYMLAEFNARNAAALAVLAGRHGVQLRRFPDAVLHALGTAAGEVVAEAGNADAFTRRVYDSFLAYRSQAIAWSKTAEQAYLTARLLPFKYGEPA